MRFFSESRDAEYYACKVKDTGGVYLVPAFTGLGAPHWDMYARGCLIGLTRGTTREHIIRAAQESIAYQVNDLLTAMKRDTGVALSSLSVDGGASRDSFLMQFQADISNCARRLRSARAILQAWQPASGAAGTNSRSCGAAIHFMLPRWRMRSAAGC